MPFEDGSFDVVFSCHVVEHFKAWEIPGVLLEWIRVLRPGGKLVAELPDLVKCLHLLLYADQTEDAEVFKLAMNGIYSDPKFRSLEMRHYWGYTPKTLCSLFSSVGLVNCREEPAKFKMKDYRDMRVVGEKP